MLYDRQKFIKKVNFEIMRTAKFDLNLCEYSKCQKVPILKKCEKTLPNRYCFFQKCQN